MACAGIDFGSRRSVVAIARRGGVDICCNEVSNRSTPSLVSFSGDKRHIGEAAANYAGQNPAGTVAGIQRLLGVPFDSQFSEAERERVTAKTVPTKQGGIAVEVPYALAGEGEDGNESTTTLPIESLAGMLFASLLDIASAEYKAPVRDCVVTVPSYYTDTQRRAVLAGATIGNVNVLRIVNEHVAVAVSYGIFRTKELPAEDPVKVAFVDMGDASTTVTIAAFTSKKAEVLSVASDASLGGRDFDALLATVFADQFKEKYKIDAMSKPRAKLRLLKECEKVKRILSANSEAPLNIECLMNDIDVSGHMKRDDLEEMTAPLIERLKACCTRAIEGANLGSDGKLLSVEIVGASTRIPAVKAAVQSCFEPHGAALKTTLNMDECVARGAAMISAMLSPAFRVLDYEIKDIAPYAIDAVRVPDAGNQETVGLVAQSSPLPCSKAMTFKARGPLRVDLKYKDPSAIPSGEKGSEIGSYRIEAPEDPEAEVRAKVKVNANGVVEMTGAQLIKEVEVPEETPKEPTPPAAENAEPAPAEPASGSAEPTETSEKDQDGDVAMAEKSTDANGAAPAATPEPRMVKKVQKTDIPVTGAPAGCGLGMQEVSAAVDREAQMKAADTYMRERSDALNGLESYVYDLRSRIDEYGDLKDYGPESVREPLRKELDDIEEWIYSEEGDNANKSAFVKRKEDLVAKAMPMISRKRERDERPVAISAFENVLESYKKLAVPNAEEYNHIPEAEKQKAIKAVEDATLWLRGEMTKQEKLALDVDPVLTCAILRAKRAEVDGICGPIEKTPKPAPKVEEPADAKQDAAAPGAEQNGNGSADAGAGTNGNAAPTPDGKAEEGEPPASVPDAEQASSDGKAKPTEVPAKSGKEMDADWQGTDAPDPAASETPTN